MIDYNHPSPNDALDMLHVHRTSVRQLAAQYYTSEEIELWVPLIEEKHLENLTRAIKADQDLFWVAHDGESLCGFGALNSDRNFVQALFVLPRCVGRGIGRNLLNFLEESAIVRDLSLHASLNSVDFYKKCGYTGSDRVLNHFDGWNSGIWSINMTKRLPG